jgi:hypothetical protein
MIRLYKEKETKIIDWGQDFMYTKEWYQQLRECRDVAGVILLF